MRKPNTNKKEEEEEEVEVALFKWNISWQKKCNQA